MRTVEELVARAPDRFDITVIGGEPHPNYNCILLSSVLAGEVLSSECKQRADFLGRAVGGWGPTPVASNYTQMSG